MTKRFWYDFEDPYGAKMVDFVDDKEYSLETIGDFREIENLLNTLSEENEQLQEQREKLFFRERDTKNRWRELKQENESLKEENKFLRNKVATYKSGNALLKKSIDKEWK